MDAATDLTQVLAAQASALSYQDLPAPAREIARQCVLDYLGVALAGAGDPLVRILLDELAEAGGSPQASIMAIRQDYRHYRRHSLMARRHMRLITTMSTWQCPAIPRWRSFPACSP
jgi:MmgE/PrpD N-terminal domain